MRRRGIASWIVPALLVSAACTGVDSNPTVATPPPTSPHRTDAASATTPKSSPATPGDQQTYVEPLVLAFDVHRPALRLGARQARQVLDGEITMWREVGQPGGRFVLRRDATAVRAAATRADVLAVVPASWVRPTVQVATVAGVDPLQQPKRYPITVEADAALPRVTRVIVTGDIMLGRRVDAEAPGGAASTLRPLSGLLGKADLTIGNLESTLSEDGSPRQGDDSFAAAPDVLPALERAGFDLLSLANNHTGDYGERALRQTLRLIDDSTIARVGAGSDGRAAWSPIVLPVGSVRFGFVAFNAIGETPRASRTQPGAAEIRMQPRTGPLDLGDLARMTKLVSRLSTRTDITIVLAHWGDQYTHQPVLDQRIVGAALLEAGATLVVGGHPHWVQGVQTHQGRLVAHSLGNFIFDMDFSRQTQEGVVLELVFWDDQLRGLRFAPYVIGADFAPRLVRGPRAASILNAVWQASDTPFRQ